MQVPLADHVAKLSIDNSSLVIAKKTLNEILDTLITQCQTKNTNAVRIVSKRGEIVSDVIQTWT